MATTARKHRRRALVSAALLSTAPALFGCAETEQPAPDAGTGQTTTPPQKTDESPEASAPARAEASSTDLGAYTAQVGEGLPTYAGQQVTLTGEVADLIPSRSALVLTDPEDPGVDPLLVSARYTFSEAEEGAVVEVTGTVREDFAAPVVEEATGGDEESGFYARHLGEPYLDEAEVSAAEPAGQ